MRKYFEEIKDKRQEWKVKHKLIEILITGICAVISGCEYFEDIANFCRVKSDWFREKLGLKLSNGTASHDTYERVFGMIEPKEFERCFAAWVRSIRKKMKDEIVSIDGKTVCGSGNEEKTAIQMVLTRQRSHASVFRVFDKVVIKERGNPTFLHEKRPHDVPSFRFDFIRINRILIQEDG